MGRALVLVALVAAMVATGVAGAAPADTVRLPVTTFHDASTPTTVVVEKGDHLWKISARHLGREAAIAPYWRRVVEVNTPHLRSGDPDLIYPGEVVELPPISERQ